MTWIRLSDDFLSHPKFVALGNDHYALRAWLELLSYCARHATNGYIGETALRRLRIPRRVVDRLALPPPGFEAGLLDALGGDVWRIHNWERYAGPSSAEQSARGRLGGRASAAARAAREPSGGSRAFREPSAAVPAPFREAVPNRRENDGGPFALPPKSSERDEIGEAPAQALFQPTAQASPDPDPVPKETEGEPLEAAPRRNRAILLDEFVCAVNEALPSGSWARPRSRVAEEIGEALDGTITKALGKASGRSANVLVRELGHRWVKFATTAGSRASTGSPYAVRDWLGSGAPELPPPPPPPLRLIPGAGSPTPIVKAQLPRELPSEELADEATIAAAREHVLKLPG